MERHTTIFIKDLKPLNFCGKIIGHEAILNAYEIPFEIEPTTGEHDFNKCPVCQRNLEQFKKEFKAYFEGNGDSKKAFPFCCEHHVNLLKLKEYNRDSFVNAPEMVAMKIIYTNQHIINNFKSENAYKVITDYIDWVIESFGQMPQGCGESLYFGKYFHYVSELLERNGEIPNETKEMVLAHFNTYFTPPKNNQTDINILLKTYQEWLEYFPFGIDSYFKNLRQRYERQIPLFYGKPELNPYSGKAKMKMHTRNSLIELLIDTTNSLLIQFNGEALFSKGLVTNSNRIKLELIIEGRKLKLKEGYKISSPNKEYRYRKILKEWLKDEKAFWNELNPLLNNESDMDFIRGSFKLVFTPQGNSGIFTVIKEEQERKYTVEKYFDLDLRNWELDIHNATTKQEKTRIANNGIFNLRKQRLDNEHPAIQAQIDRSVQHLKHIIEYIESSFVENVPPPKEEPNIEKQAPDFVKELNEISNSENKFWKGLPMQRVIDHFKIMTETKSKNGKAFLTKEQLISFLKKGFLNDTKQPKQKINVANGEKGFVIKRFYEFFVLAVSEYGYPSRKEKFYKLFSGCFDNWNPKTITSLFKPNKVKENW